MLRSVFFFTLLFSICGLAWGQPLAEMIFTSRVVATTCDVAVSTPNLAFAPLPQATATATATELTRTEAESAKKFFVGLNNCGMPLSGGPVYLKITGQTLKGRPDIFNAAGQHAGIMFTAAGRHIKSGDTLMIANPSVALGQAGDFIGGRWHLHARPEGTSPWLEPEEINAAVLFSVVYN